jgi:hypothetical protein
MYALDYGRYRDSIERWGLLDDDHQVEFEEDEKLEESINWDEEFHDEPKAADEEFYVNCEGCEREIEFGWTHPDRGGRIWPAECADFNPGMCWPEPRYREAWAEKNWLQPKNELRGAGSK